MVTLKSIVSSVASALSGSTPSVYTCPVGIDISHYQKNIDWDYLKDKIDFVVLKAGELQYDDQPDDQFQDDTLNKHIQGAYDAGIPCGIYMFHNPAWYSNWSGDIENMTPDQDRQLTLLRNVLKSKVFGKSFHFFVLDFERWWVSYTDYNKNGSSAARVTPFWINASAKRFLTNLELTYPDLVGKDMVYSAKWFMEYATTSAYDWLCKRPVWDARYITGRPHGKTFTSWDDLRKNLPYTNTKPDYLNSNPLIWQVGIASMPNGKYGQTAFDIDIWYGGNGLGTVESMRKWMNYKQEPATPGPEPEPEPETEEVMTVLKRIEEKIDAIKAATVK